GGREAGLQVTSLPLQSSRPAPRSQETLHALGLSAEPRSAQQQAALSAIRGAAGGGAVLVIGAATLVGAEGRGGRRGGGILDRLDRLSDAAGDGGDEFRRRGGVRLVAGWLD